MAKTIGNPLSWTVSAFGSAFSHSSAAVRSVGALDGAPAAEPVIRTLTTDDLKTALRKGWEDVQAFRSDVVFVCLLYPVIGGLLVAMALQGNLIHLLFPVLSGFALTGPVAAVGLYEMSRRREAGVETGWTALFDVIASPKVGSVLALALMHAVIFMAWLMAANLIFDMTIGPEVPSTVAAFTAAVFGTAAGWAMIVIGVAVGFVFAVMVLVFSVVSFPMLLDRDVSLPVAVKTSVAVARKNPVVIATWGLIVAGALALGSIPALVGLVLVLPILGHATWHLYRAAVG
ncbi:DUF2189 domain-containing protein [Tabrizicola sp.]|uniref:DUF2189 domain-containing protein n=1 Tax=Tabrizicola sp. TaxID=2005166 RepID=UPI003F3C1BCA